MVRRTKIEISEERKAHRDLAESSFEDFIHLVQAKRWLGNIHRDVCKWWISGSRHKLLLLPRDHMKSALAGLWVTWRLTKDPTLRILYISSTSNLATKQLKFMKAKREKWTEREISLDHPSRKEAYIRDPSIFTAGLTSNIVGMHSDITVLDDVVVSNNAYTEEGREKVRDQYSLLSSIETVNAEELVVGTRYHPLDLYNSLVEMEVQGHDEFGNIISKEPLFDVKEYPVETAGDGTGEFLWPRSKAPTGKWYGFDAKVLADKRAQYLNKTHYRAQYYNDPHDIDSSPIKRDLFQYYDQNYISRRDHQWFFKRERINVFAAVDFAYSLDKRADFSSIVVLGIDGNQNYYILEIDRFKTDKMSEYYNRILKLYEKWGFRKLRAEVSVAQKVIVEDLKENYIRKNGLTLSIDEYRPSRWQGSKEERIMSTLEPRYANRQIWHYQGGNCQQLEEELTFSNPSHDDIKDALASVIDFAQGKSPVDLFNRKSSQVPTYNFHSKYGGVA